MLKGWGKSMTPEQFYYWLQGFLAGAGRSNGLDCEQLESVVKRMGSVVPSTPSYIGAPTTIPWEQPTTMPWQPGTTIC